MDKKEPSREKLDSTDSIPQDYNKLLEFQRKVAAIPKDSTNPFFKSKYFDVNTVISIIKPILNEIGLVVVQPLQIIDGKNTIETIIYDGEGRIATSTVLLPDIADVQKFGAAITYFRRYALVSLLLLEGEEDDDGNTAVKQNSAPTAPQVQKPTNDITEKQKGLISVLMKEKGVLKLSDIGIEPIVKPTSADASMIIKKLQDYQIGENVIQLEERDFPL